MNDKVDWDKAIEYVGSDGWIYPCDDLGVDSKGHHAVLVHFGGGLQLRICLEGGQNPGWGAYIRNKREYAYQWLVKEADLDTSPWFLSNHRTEASAREAFGNLLIRPIEETKREVE